MKMADQNHNLLGCGCLCVSVCEVWVSALVFVKCGCLCVSVCEVWVKCVVYTMVNAS